MEYTIEIKERIACIRCKCGNAGAIKRQSLRFRRILHTHLGKHWAGAHDPNTKCLFTGEENGILLLSSLINDNEEDFCPLLLI